MDYSELPEELIEKIARDHLHAYPQLLAFSKVCRSWRSTALRLHSRRRPCLPGLLVPKQIESQNPLAAYYNGDFIHEFYPLASITSPATALPRAALPFFPVPNKVSDAFGQRNHYRHLHHNAVDKLLDAAFQPNQDDDADADADEDEHLSPFWFDDEYSFDDTSARSLGSKDGWILRSRPDDYDGRPLELYLLNPFTGASVPLPPLPTYSVRHISKAIISSSPDDDDQDCHVFILPRWGMGVEWCKVGGGGQAGWGFIDGRDHENSEGGQAGWGFIVDGHHENNFGWASSYPVDAVYFGGNLYVVGNRGRVLVFDITSGSAPPSLTKSIPFSKAMYNDEEEEERMTWRFCRVCELNGQLLVIILSRDQDQSGSMVSRVFKLHSNGDDTTSYYWEEEVKSLDGHGVFIGPHESFSIPAATAGGGGVKGDHIYMTLDYTRPGPCWLRGQNWDGVFDLANHKLESLALRRRDDIHRDTLPSFWFLPVTWDISKLHDKHHMEEKKAWKRERLLPGSECWKLPKRAVRNPKHPAHHNNITRTNRFRALLSDDEEDDDDEED